jgi:hypothetical protein
LTKAKQVVIIPGMDATELMRKSFEDSSFGIPDPRNGDNRQYPKKDFILCAFACFFLSKLLIFTISKINGIYKKYI